MSKCFGCVYTSFGGDIGDLQRYVAVRMAWSDWPVLCVVTCVIL